MKAIILAAGRGSRLGDITDDRPKCMLDLNGRSLFQRQCDALKEAGISDIAVVRGYRREQFDDCGLTLFDNPRWSETNMVRSLEAARDWLAAGPCIVSYADIFYPAGAVTALMASGHDLAIGYDPQWRDLWMQRFDDPLQDAETFRLHLDHTVREIGNRPASMDEIEGQYVGLLAFTPTGWSRIAAYLAALPPAAVDRLDMTGMLRGLLHEGTRIGATPVPAPWGEVDTPRDLALYRSWPV